MLRVILSVVTLSRDLDAASPLALVITNEVFLDFPVSMYHPLSNFLALCASEKCSTP